MSKKSNNLSNLSLVLATLVFILVGFTSYLVYQNKSLIKQNNNLTSDWKTYTSKKINQLSFPSFSLKYPQSWSFSEDYVDNGASLNFKLSKAGYSLEITQAPMGGLVCLFNDSPDFEGPSSGLRSNNYFQIQSNIGNLRYYNQPETNSDYYYFCQQEETHYVSPTIIGRIEIIQSTIHNTQVFQEAINIIKTISTN